jgi:hypothetical protein
VEEMGMGNFAHFAKLLGFTGTSTWLQLWWFWERERERNTDRHTDRRTLFAEQIGRRDSQTKLPTLRRHIQQHYWRPFVALVRKTHYYHCTWYSSQQPCEEHLLPHKGFVGCGPHLHNCWVQLQFFVYFSNPQCGCYASQQQMLLMSPSSYETFLLPDCALLTAYN